MVYGGLALYAPITILWPLSYVGSPGMSDLYLKVNNALSGLATLLHVVVLLMLWYSSRMYLYETALDY